MFHKTFHQVAIAVAFTALLTGSKAPTQAQSVSSVFSSRRHASVFVTRQDAYWLGRASLARFWNGGTFK